MKQFDAVAMFLLGALSALLIGILSVSFANNLNRSSDGGSVLERLFGIEPYTQSDEQRVIQAEQYKAPLDYEEAIITAVEKSADSVVSMIVTKDLPIIERCGRDPLSDLPPEIRQFFEPFEFDFSEPCETGTRTEEIGGGSGFVVSNDGLIITNKHVVSDEDADYTVVTNKGKRYPATILARDPVQDIAIVRVNNINGIKPLTLGNSDGIKLGQTAIAIGNALGEFRDTVSVGVVSGLAREIVASDGASFERIEGLIQTDAAINPGNSGGPLLNLRGEVIGINTAVARGAQNIGFAIPINKAKRDIESVMRDGRITVPYMGVRYRAIDEEFAEQEGLLVTQGALIRGTDEGPAVLPNSPAAKAGIQAEDIITKVDGKRVQEGQSLATLIQEMNVGDTITLEILRNGTTLTLSVLLEERDF